MTGQTGHNGPRCTGVDDICNDVVLRTRRGPLPNAICISKNFKVRKVKDYKSAQALAFAYVECGSPLVPHTNRCDLLPQHR